MKMKKTLANISLYCTISSLSMTADADDGYDDILAARAAHLINNRSIALKRSIPTSTARALGLDKSCR